MHQEDYYFWLGVSKYAYQSPDLPNLPSRIGMALWEIVWNERLIKF